MITWFVNIAVIILGVYIIKDLKKGFCAAICARILIPEVARIQFFGINLAIYDFLIICIAASFFWNLYKGKLSVYDGESPAGLLWIIIFYNLSAGALILLSADLIPPEDQFKFLLKTAFQESFYLIAGVYALRDVDKKYFFDLMIVVAVCAGLYGIYAYMTSSNPYIMSIITTYAEDNGYDNFLTEARGALKGRTSGTLTHPLAWGQLWGLLLSFYAVLSQTEKRSARTDIAITFLGLTNILLCGSRSALIMIGVFAVFFFFSRKRAVRLKIVAVLFVLFAGVLALPVNESKYPVVTYVKSAVFFWDDSYSYSVGVQGSNADMRLEQLDEVIGIMEAFPLGGMGYKSTDVLEDHPMFERMRGFESIAFRKTIEQGWIGFLCFIISFALFAIWCVRNTSTKKERLFMIGYFVSYFASILVTGIQGTWFIFLLLPLLYSSGLKKEIENDEECVGELDDQS